MLRAASATWWIRGVRRQGPRALSAVCLLAGLGLTSAWVAQARGDDTPNRAEAVEAIRKACRYFVEHAGTEGGYVWQVSRDGELREGEGVVTPTQVWVQPPGTPAVGQALLEAYLATGDEEILGYARDTAHLLAKHRLRSGGWWYSIELDPEKRIGYAYRDLPDGRGKARNKSTLDDDTTQSVLRFLMSFDAATDFQDELVHEAATGGLDALLAAQRPNGGWYQWWEGTPQPVSVEDFPVIPASYPDEWSRKWLNDWTGKYYLNDAASLRAMEALWKGYEVYGDDDYRAGAEKGGGFLILAQMPAPQPAWAQQYDEHMHPVWDRKFEPPAISGSESQSVIETLLLLYRKTSNPAYLEPIPRALDYLEGSLLPDGQLARFYELKTNRPLYFWREGRTYHLTYDDDALPDHYGFQVSSRLDRLREEYGRCVAGEPEPTRNLSYHRWRARKVFETMNEDFAWVQKMRMPHHRVEPESGVLPSQAFVQNIGYLADHVRALDAKTE